MGDLANSYHTAFNNQLNAQKAYINSYLDGINARNAVNQEARTQDQYYNYTQPLQASNLGLTLAQQSLLTEMANDPTNRQYQKTITASDLGYRAGMGEQNMLNLPTDRKTSSNVASTNNTNSVFNKKASEFSLSTQGDLQKIEKDRIEQLKKAYPLMNEAQLLALDSQISSLKNPPTTTQIFGANPNGTPATIMLPNGGTPSMDKPWTSRYLNPTVTTPASGLPSNPSNTQNSQATSNSNPFLSTNYSADQLKSALGNLTSSTDSVLGSIPDMFLSPENRARKAAFNSNYELIKQARDIKLAEQKAQKQIESQAYLKSLTDQALAKQRINSGLK